MFRLFIFCFLYGLAGCNTITQESGTVVITGVTIFDTVEGTLANEPKDILIKGDRIVKILPSGSATYNAGIRHFDGRDKYAIPGLWDMHAHPDDPEIWRMNPTEDEKDRLLNLLVLHGVTGIRDMAGELQLANRWKEKVRGGQLLGPEIYAAGPLIDGPNPMWDGSVGIDGPGNVKEVVDSLIVAGVDFLKVYSLLPGDIYLELQRYANEINFPVAGHVPYDITPSQAAKAGMKSQEHFLEILQEVSTRSSDLDSDNIDYQGATTGLERYIFRNRLMIDTYSEDKAKSLFRLMAENRSWHTPTLSMWHKNAWFEREIKADTVLYRYLPPYMRRYWQLDENDHLQNRAPELLELKRDLVVMYQKLLRLMSEEGVPLMVGTDMGANPLCFPGIGVHNELEMFVKSGIPAEEALKAATINPCRYLEIEDDFGSIASGKVADLVILNGNPVKDITAVRNISAVVRKGNILDRDSIDSVLRSIVSQFN